MIPRFDGRRPPVKDCNYTATSANVGTPFSIQSVTLNNYPNINSAAELTSFSVKTRGNTSSAPLLSPNGNS
ncbi:hypothetical protein TNCV_2381921 [Trichonephila clavipes]|nr:hypothetical protein TNCV_2381921 [Trichonephila clavipes]